MENNNEAFSFTYSAKEQEELKRIRTKYMREEENKLELLRRLDKSVTSKGTTISIAVGVIGTLILGTGMSCVMELGQDWMIPGIAIGAVGMVTVALAYPIYRRITRKERERIAPEIIRLTDELMK